MIHEYGFVFALALSEAEERALRRRGWKQEELKLHSPSDKNTASSHDIFSKAGKRALGGGIPGAFAGVIQVVSLMWLRTIINYQSRYGMTLSKALESLLREGGVARLYRGLGFALIQAPLSRFVSTASNDGVNALLSSLSMTKDWGSGTTTAVAAIVVGAARICIMRT